MKNYSPIQNGEKWTICEFNDDSIIINDGIYKYYWWNSKEEAKKAADAYNSYEGKYPPKKGEKLRLHDQVYLADDKETIRLYTLFDALHAIEDYTLDELCDTLAVIEFFECSDSGLVDFGKGGFKPTDGVTRDKIEEEFKKRLQPRND